ncbi:Outer membrane protein beta-barrel domain-containing protein [Chitinophaga jiangningensis]|uniref:Outer membrane protein beta-barrel domain-containing protein n=1 Tax=Chitinophaga jiangningensis TaxID=1419482 RepID=A0A1M7LVT7_9BACT|nr:outer membrane beta-barrel protein [Chitinophaga jiangningensis]SHM82406.1 Outer membrane protein beta-barrel domain-containing protein [Chitinophaga jiangningensis]
MKKYILLGAMLLTSGISAFAQSNNKMTNLFGLSWEISIPTNNEFLDKTSLAGGRLEYRHFLPNAPVSFGLGLSWNSYEQYTPTQTVYYKDGNSAITTDMDRVIYTVPVTATAHYYFNSWKPVMPYIGVGLGAMYAEQTIYYNIFEDNTYNWGFVVRPEVGVLIRPNNGNWGILAGAHYQYATNKNDLFDQNSLKSFGFNVGFFLSR